MRTENQRESDNVEGRRNEAGGGGEVLQPQQQPAERPPADDKDARFVSVVLADTIIATHLNPTACN